MKRRMFLSFMILLLSIFFLPEMSADVNAKRSHPYYITVDGVMYQLMPEYGSAYAYLASVEEQKTMSPRSEIVVQNEITYEGRTYRVGSFDTDRWDNTIDEVVWMRYPYKPTYYQQNLKKITIEEGIQFVSFDMAHYHALEEFVFEDIFSAITINMNIWDCPKLKDIYVPAGVNLIPRLRECPNTSVIYAPDHERYCTIDGEIYSKDGKILYDVPGDFRTYTVRKGVRLVGAAAFSCNDFIREIILPSSVRKVDPAAFSNMKNLKSVKLSKNLKRIDGSCFKRSMKLKELILPKNIQKIDGGFGGKDNCKIKKLYIRTTRLKKAFFRGLPASCKIYVKNDAVKKKIQKQSKFKGKIIVQAKK